MAVGLHVHYRRSEQCLSALRLAEQLERLGHRAVLYSPTPPKSFGSSWDKQVLHGTEVFDMCSRAMDWWVWFDFLPESFNKLQENTRDSKVPSTLVLSRHRCSELFRLRCFDRFHSIVCPSESAALALRESEIEADQWTIPGDVLGPFQTQIDPLPYSLYCEIGECQYGSGMLLLDALNEVMTRHRSLKLTLAVMVASLPKQVLTEVRRMAAADRRRITLSESPSFVQHKVDLAKHQFSLILDREDDFGYFCLESLSLGVPVICFDIAPRNEFLANCSNAVLIPCDLQLGPLDAPRALLTNPNNLIQAIEEAFWGDRGKSVRNSVNFEKTRELLVARRQRFVTGWRDLLKAVTD